MKKTLEQITEEIYNLKKCGQIKHWTNAVPGDGSPKAEIVFVGEAPGREEDLQGKPFVGKAGKLLDELLLSVNLNRDDVFITNIVKFRPPNNRDPFDEEIKICAKFLWDQLDIIKPKLVIPLGRHAMYFFLGKDKIISKMRGALKEITNKKTGKTLFVMPLYHPATALYNSSMKDVLFDDFKKIPRALKRIKTLKLPSADFKDKF